MKFIHLSDPHVSAEPDIIKGVDTGQNLGKAIAYVNQTHADADFILLTGDLVDRGTVEEYGRLKDVLSDSSVPVNMILGNHDCRVSFRSVFPTATTDDNGFIQYSLELGSGTLLALDSLSPDPKAVGGELCSLRLDWLSQKLADNVDRDIYIAIHHPPWPVKVPFMDRWGLQNPETFVTLLKGHGRVRHVFLGHLHRPVHGIWSGIPWSCQPSTFYQIPFTMSEEKNPVLSQLPPAIGIVIMEGGNLIHHNEYIPGATLRTQ